VLHHQTKRVCDAFGVFDSKRFGQQLVLCDIVTSDTNNLTLLSKM
jgi:hypothetical protein